MLFPVSLAPYETLKTWECFDADTGKDSATSAKGADASGQATGESTNR